MFKGERGNSLMINNSPQDIIVEGIGGLRVLLALIFNSWDKGREMSIVGVSSVRFMPKDNKPDHIYRVRGDWTQVTGDAPPKMSKEVNMGTRFWYEEQTSRYLSETLSEIKALEGQMTMMSEKLARLQDVAKAFETALRTIKEEQERR